uniref:Uncharacterized protein n=1 Tax=Eutreptiella gymnastica TaxID=73025 RepID=A0A7S4CTI0_9EUGL
MCHLHTRGHSIAIAYPAQGICWVSTAGTQNPDTAILDHLLSLKNAPSTVCWPEHMMEHFCPFIWQRATILSLPKQTRFHCMYAASLTPWTPPHNSAICRVFIHAAQQKGS